MRVGVDYRILAVGRELFHRGIGRYTQQQLRAVLDADTGDEYVLMCNDGSDLSLIDPRIAGAPNVSIRTYEADPLDSPPMGDAATLLSQAERYFDWVSALGLDVFHATAAFLFVRPVLVDFDVCPMVASFYDLIPLIFPDKYLTGWWEEQYLRTVAFLKRSDRMVAISEAAKTDAATFLGYPADRVDVAWPVADECFRVLQPDELAGALSRLRARMRLPERYVLTVSHLHHSKNLMSLLRGYASLPEALRAALPMVVCCYLDEDGLAYIGKRLERLGISADVVLTGLVSDDELTALYNAATMVVHPSRYEGFGLPVVEAMRCGAPVVTTTASSLPEVGGDAAILVDPDDAGAFAQAIVSLNDDPVRCLEMAERGHAHAAIFNRDQLAASTIACYRAAQAPPPQLVARPRLAVWSPMPPQRSGISDYTVELLAKLRDRYEIEVFVDDGVLPTTNMLLEHRFEHFTAIGRRQRQAPFDAFLYQMGGSQFHLYMYDAMRTYPGVVVLHDLTWSHVLYSVAFDTGDYDRFRDQAVAIAGGEAGAAFDIVQGAHARLRHRVLDRFLLDHPLLDEVIATSLTEVVHLEPVADKLRRRYPDARVAVVPMGVSDPGQADGGDIRTAKARIGVSPWTFVVGTFGIVHVSKHTEACINAFARLAETHPNSLLLVVGRPIPDDYVDHLRSVVERLGLSSKVRFSGFVERAALDDHMLASDVIVNLRAPTTPHMSATLMRALAAGRPVVMTDLPEWRQIPDDAVMRVSVGEESTDTLGNCLEHLATDTGARSRLAASARRFYEEHGSLEAMAAGYVDVLDRAIVDGRAYGAHGAPSEHSAQGPRRGTVPEPALMSVPPCQ